MEEPAAAAPKETAPKSVGELVRFVKGTLEGHAELRGVWVAGEISNFKEAGSGHWYFTLKDADAQIRCAMFAGANRGVDFAVKDGVSVLAKGDVSVYAQRGDLQLKVDAMKKEGAGALAEALEALKKKLAAEGLFDERKKRRLPALPLRVGVVTSATGAVWHDIQKVALRRFPPMRLVLAPVRVQGEGAAAEIAQAIARFNAASSVDVLIVGRGGGSLEDLWAFNEEAVVRAIRASAIPVVSAVGHETDFTLADFAADVRAATPSQAAELVTPIEITSLLASLAEAETRLARGLAKTVEHLAERTDDATERLAFAAKVLLGRKGQTLAHHAGRLEALSPLGVLARGYAIATEADGKLVRSAKGLAPKDRLRVRFADGEVDSTITDVRKNGEGHVRK